MRSAPVIAFATAIALFATSCSLFLVRRAPARIDESQYPDCTDTPGAPLVDGLLGGMSTLAFVSILRDGGGDETEPAVIMGVLAALYLSSSAYGFKATSRCKRLRKNATVPSDSGVDFTRDSTLEDDASAVEYGVAGKPCYGNNTCDTGLYCDKQRGLCVPGNRGTLNGPCLADSTCNPGLTCEQGVCTGSAHAECKLDEHCPDGEVCEDGQCIPAPTPAPI